ncbi:class I histocompatibility antigen, F10 alpha chain-like [Sinocyclocheilus anshuiensis]|uniref:class I histocompatibility antigen, F10 alpha chain-like n=1 Tax=Sinocyclocheilus anshuiensis TaxID=1608454 RepID=UPI0007B99A74|nr:PREDICTED: class I histocompatibility antigen, F10 alpha chain-like [Sinocyclocheilus anshuiensis]
MVKHYLHYRFTAQTKADTLPEFSAVVVVDDKQIKHYSNEKRVWIVTEHDWTEAPEEPPDSRDWFIHQTRTLSNCAYSECSELHVLQRIIGCELNTFLNGTMTNLTAFDKYGFDGEDFMDFSSDALQWIDKNPKAKETKMKWDQQTERNELLQHYLQTCMNWISTFNNTQKTPPDVCVFAVEALDDQGKLVLSCLATGFYPRDIEMNIRLDRINTENKTLSAVRPKADGSFQLRTSVKIDRNHKGSYDCLVNHSSLTEPASTNWGGTCFDSETLWPVIVGVVVAVVAVLVSACWLCVNYPTIFMIFSGGTVVQLNVTLMVQ